MDHTTTQESLWGLAQGVVLQSVTSETDKNTFRIQIRFFHLRTYKCLKNCLIFKMNLRINAMFQIAST